MKRNAAHRIFMLRLPWLSDWRLELAQGRSKGETEAIVSKSRKGIPISMTEKNLPEGKTCILPANCSPVPTKSLTKLEADRGRKINLCEGT